MQMEPMDLIRLLGPLEAAAVVAVAMHQVPEVRGVREPLALAVLAVARVPVAIVVPGVTAAQARLL